MRIKIIFTIAFLVGALSSTIAHAQYLSKDSTSLRIQSSVPFYKWEVGIDLLPLIDKSQDPYGYVFKRTYLTSEGRKSIRFKFLPWFLSGIGAGSGVDEKQYSIFFSLGVEKQRIWGRFAIIYGLDPFFRNTFLQDKSTVTGLVLVKRTDIYLGASAFIGGRYYITNHLSATLESHLIYEYRDYNAYESWIGSIFYRTHTISTKPINTLYLSYHF
ncbi:MAG: hypothetical protein QM669_11300 [Siphonobacter sp.]